jgi:hypothetical protein
MASLLNSESPFEIWAFRVAPKYIIPCAGKGCVFLLLPPLQTRGFCADITTTIVFDFSDYVGFSSHAQVLFLAFQIGHFHGGLILNVSYRLDTVAGGTVLVRFLYGRIHRYHYGVMVQAVYDIKIGGC